MGRPAAITHADIAPRRRRTAELGSKIGVLLTILCILCGLLCFVLCLIAEATRSEVTWVSSPNHVDNSNGHSTSGGKYECEYSGSGKTPFVCAATASMGLAGAMLLQHSFMLLAMSSINPPTLVSQVPPYNHPAGPFKSLGRQAAFFFVSTWICFSVAEIMLLIGLSVESGHLKNWSTPRKNCLVIQEGVFTAAGVFALATVFLAAGLYVSALRIQWLCEQQDGIRREVMEASASAIYLSSASSPPRSPLHPCAPRVEPCGVTPLSFQHPSDQSKPQIGTV